MWHASVAMRTASGPAPTEMLHRWQRRAGAALAASLLEGVGTGPLIEHVKEVSLHARRALTDRELAGLDPAWLAIEPVDMG